MIYKTECIQVERGLLGVKGRKREWGEKMEKGNGEEAQPQQKLCIKSL